jgi:outer membrane lipoprotein SlyB
MEQAGAQTHPILIAAGVAVLLFSLLGAAALTGVLPSASSFGSSSAGSAKSTNGGANGTKSAAAAKPAGKSCATCGVIESIRAVEMKGESSGLGAVAGGVAGGVVGNQFGHGGTRTLLTIGGAAGGAFAGDAIEKNLKKHVAWRVDVRLSDGTLRTLSQKAQPPFAVGDRVRIVDGSGIERA